MKRCLVCNHMAADSDPSCAKCGEGSWAWVVDVAPAAPTTKKKSAKKSAKVEAAPVEPAAPAISDEEFAAELASASEADLLGLFGDESLSPAWRKLVEVEIAKRVE